MSLSKCCKASGHTNSSCGLSISEANLAQPWAFREPEGSPAAFRFAYLPPLGVAFVAEFLVVFGAFVTT